MFQPLNSWTALTYLCSNHALNSNGHPPLPSPGGTEWGSGGGGSSFLTGGAMAMGATNSTTLATGGLPRGEGSRFERRPSSRQRREDGGQAASYGGQVHDQQW